MIIEKIIIDLEDELVNLLEKEKANLETIKSLKSKGLESSENVISESENQSEDDCLVVEKECDKEENPKVSAPEMFKLSVSQCVSSISMSKTSCEYYNVENLDNFSSVKRPKHIGVIWKKKWSSNTSNVDLSVGLEVAFRKTTCFVRNEDGVDLFIGDRSSNLYTIALNEVVSNSSTCLLEKASSSQSWLWHPRLSYLNFTTINNLVKNNLVQDDYSRYTWVFFLHSKDEASEVIISFIKKTQVNLQLQVQRVRTDNGMEFKYKTLAKFFDEVGITQQFSVARTPQQNGVVERRNRTLVEAARTMFTFANLPLFLWAEVIAIACFIQNCSIIHKRFDKTPYELINKRKPNIKFFRVFGCRCYLLNDYADVRKLKAKGDIGVDIQKNLWLSEFTTIKLIMKSSTMNVDTSINDEVFHEVSESFQGESSLSSLNDDVQQSPEEVILPQKILSRIQTT
nr:putative ribonuclease H-like domain-containing protein [Tanacetum cinerariifolium]